MFLFDFEEGLDLDPSRCRQPAAIDDARPAHPRRDRDRGAEDGAPHADDEWLERAVGDRDLDLVLGRRRAATQEQSAEQPRDLQHHFTVYPQILEGPVRVELTLAEPQSAVPPQHFGPEYWSA